MVDKLQALETPVLQFVGRTILQVVDKFFEMMGI